MITLLKMGTVYRPNLASKDWYAKRAYIWGLIWRHSSSMVTYGCGCMSGNSLVRSLDRTVYSIDWTRY